MSADFCQHTVGVLIKNILEEMGGKIELVYYDLLNNKEEYINTKTNIQIFFEHTFVINANNFKSL